jgi:superfamily I DNA/RNA helicase
MNCCNIPASRRLREENFHVILDEAQDTDPAQFSVLTEITRPPDATGLWLETETAPSTAWSFLHGRRFSAVDLSRPR